MKFNWATFKVLFAFVFAAGIIFWAFDSVHSSSYSGRSLNFNVQGGIVNLTNSGAEPVAVQLLGTGSRTFKVTSSIEGVAGSSLREGIGTDRSQLFEFDLPPGKSTFSVTGGSNITFVADTGTRIDATVNPMSNDARRTTLIVTAVMVLVALYYASNATNHQWIKIVRHRFFSKQDELTQDTKPTASIPVGGQGHAPHSYGDNRAETGD